MNQSLTKINEQRDRSLAIVEGRNSLAKLNMRELRELAEVFVASGQFNDIKSIAQAQVKILAGAELGFSAIVSMSGIHFFNGKVSIGANLIAADIFRGTAPDSDTPYDDDLETSAMDDAAAQNVTVDGELVDTETGEVVDYVAPEVTAEPPPDEDPIDEEESKLEDLRTHVYSLLTGLTPSRQKDIQAGKTPVSKADYDELIAYQTAIQAEA